MYLDGLKGIAALMILQGHYFGIYKCAESPFELPKAVGYILNGYVPFSLLSGETTWLVLFMIISGFLMARKQISTLREAIYESVKRFARLWLPIFGACVMVFILIKCVGIHVDETRSLFTSSAFIQDSYMTELNVARIFTAPFEIVLMGEFPFADPFWMISRLFYSSLMIIVCSLIKKRTEKNDASKWAVDLVALLVSIVVDRRGVVSACVTGMILKELTEDKRVQQAANGHKPVVVLLFAIALFALSGFQDAGYYFLLRYGINLSIINYTVYWRNFWVFVVLFSLPHVKRVASFFENKFFLGLYKLNFGVYALHWPVFRSVGMLILAALAQRFDTWVAFLISYVGVVIITVALAAVFRLTVEKFSSWVLLKAFPKNKIEEASN